ncbi:MAG: hypothetical protein JNM63_05625, partial [Spirochaetia bacterium]|nr:hypothetical protein [Spirochaetia bacterium]
MPQIRKWPMTLVVIMFLAPALWGADTNQKPFFQKPTFSFFYGVDLTFWTQDDTLSSSALYKMTTARDNPLFHELKAHVGNLPLGLSLDLKFSFDNITNLGGIFSTNSALGKNGGSGGGQVLLLFPFGRNIKRLFRLADSGSDFEIDKFSAFYSWRGRAFRWENTFTGDFLSRTNFDYYNEAGSRSLYGFGKPFSSLSRSSESKFGVVWKWGGTDEGEEEDREFDDALIQMWGGLHFLDLEAPTSINIDSTNTAKPTFYSGDPLIYSHNEFGGLYFRFSIGTDPSDIQSLPTGLSVGAELGMSVGFLRTRNPFLVSAPGFASVFSGGLNVGLAFGDRGKFRFAAMLGVTADAGLMFAGAYGSDPGMITKDLAYISPILSSSTTVPAGTTAFISLS